MYHSASNATTGTATTPGGWLGYTYAAHAIIDPDAAFTQINGMSITNDNQYLDAFGASKTNLLYWSATQGASGSAPTSTTTTLSVSPSSTAAQGATVTLTATVSPSAAGTVTFKDGLTTIGSGTISGSTTSMTTSSLSVGAHSLTATFTPTDTNAFSGSSSSATSYTITSSGGGGGGPTGSNKNAVSYLGFTRATPSGLARVAVADTSYTATVRDGVIGFTSLTSARTITLPAASSVPAGKQFIIKDESGNCSSGNTITISGVIDGTTNLVLNSAYANICIYSNGTNWSRI